MFQFRSLTLVRATRTLIADASAQIHAGWRVGLNGANGKSSVFALLRGELHARLDDIGDA
jgi:ATP-binding cassette, subfamily F, member 3